MFCSSRSAHPVLQAVLCSPCIANVLKSHFKDVQPGLFFIRIFRVLNTVQSFIFKVHVVAVLSGNVRYFSTLFSLCQQLFSSFLKMKRRRRDLNPRAAINDLHPFQGCPFSLLGTSAKSRCLNISKYYIVIGKPFACPTERVGFEPTRPCGQTVFKTAS